MPSTIANIADLLSDYRRVIRNNDDISPFYIVYQVMMMVGTVLGPGSIFLMLAGSLSIAFPSIGNGTAFIINLIPLVIFIIACLTTKSANQIILAQLLSVLYALMMMAGKFGFLDMWCAPH